jgi:hypothetical protein
MLCRNFSKLSGFAALHKEYLLPHDTIHTVATLGDVHGIVEMTFAQPVKTKPSVDHYVITGSSGWLSINMSVGTKDNSPIHRIKVHTISNETGDSTEEIIEKKGDGVEAELVSFFNAIHGRNTLSIGDPTDALRDVAFIQAALTSNGASIDLEELVRT